MIIISKDIDFSNNLISCILIFIHYLLLIYFFPNLIMLIIYIYIYIYIYILNPTIIKYFKPVFNFIS